MTDRAEAAISELEDLAGRFSDGAISAEQLEYETAKYDAILDHEDTRSVCAYFRVPSIAYDLAYALMQQPE